jgi:hypothetical protein
MLLFTVRTFDLVEKKVIGNKKTAIGKCSKKVDSFDNNECHTSALFFLGDYTLTFL